MANKQRKREQGSVNHDALITAGDVIYIGDCLGVVSGKVVPASDFTYGGGGTYADLAKAQEAFAAVFAGVSAKASRSTDAFTAFVVDHEGVFEFDTASASYAVGDLVGMAGNATPTPDALHDQKVEAVTSFRGAIGRVFKATSSSTTVLVKVFPRRIGSVVAGTVYNVSFPVNLASVANGNILTGFKPGHRFVIEEWAFNVTVPVTTGSKATTLNLEIGGVDVTDGTLALTSANCTPIGAKVSEGVAISALNSGDADDLVDVEAASTTAFAEGAGVLTLRIRNLDA